MGRGIVGVLACVLVFGLTAFCAADTESASLLLEKGLHTEETVGDLDAAIEIYQKVVADAKAMRKVAAEAQYRLGVCYEKKGETRKALAAFKTVVAEYADQTRFVKQAREHLPSAGNALKRKAFLPDADTRDANVVLDLSTGKMLPAGPGRRQLAGQFLALGKGDLAWDRVLICLRNAQAHIRKGSRFESLKPAHRVKDATAYELREVPCSLRITTAEGAVFAVSVLSADEKGCMLEYAPISKTVQRLGFGPVIERVVNDNDSGQDCLIDFDTGRLYTPPPETRARDVDRDAVYGWVVKRGIDAVAEISRSTRGLDGWEIVALPVSEERWESLPSEVVKEVAQAKAPPLPRSRKPKVKISAKEDLPGTYFIKTREGGIGTLQILGFTDDPPGVKIRYKMVKMGSLGFGPAVKIAAPVVVRTSPIALSNDLSPALGEITVTFDQEMMDKSWSWTGGGDTFPKTTGSPYYDAKHTSCTLPVKLDPGKVYWVGINSRGYKNFESLAGVPAKDYVILFATLDAQGKPTPIPDRLLAKAKAINARSGPVRSQENEPARAVATMGAVKGMYASLMNAVKKKDAKAALDIMDLILPSVEKMVRDLEGTNAHDAVSAAIEQLRAARQALAKDDVARAKVLLDGFNVSGPLLEDMVKRAGK